MTDQRHYVDNAPTAKLTAAIGTTDTTFGIDSLIGFPSAGPYVITIDMGTSSAEQILVETFTGSTVDTCIRNYNGEGAFSHPNQAPVNHTAIAKDLQDSNDHIRATSNIHGISGALVDTGTAQTLTNKTLSGGTVALASTPSIPGAAVTTSADTDIGVEVKDHTGAVKMKVLGNGNTTVQALTAGAVTAASAAVTGDATVGGNVTVTGAVAAADVSAATIETTGNATVGGALATTGDATVGTNAHVEGNLQVDGTTTLTGATTVTGVLSNAGVMRFVADQTGRDALTPVAGWQVWRTDTKWVEQYDGTKWRVQGLAIVATATDLSKITDPLEGQLAMVAIESHPRRWSVSLNGWEKTVQPGSTVVTFTSTTSHTETVNFPVAFDQTPIVTIGIDSGVGATADWHVRAEGVGPTGFTLFAFREDGTAADAWTSVTVQWVAVAFGE